MGTHISRPGPKNAERSNEEPPKDVASQTARAFLGIRDRLLRGDLPRRKRIPEIRLSEELCMSRTPVRMALERLAHLGLLDAGAKGGFFVREFTVTDVRDAIEVRAVLEGTAARKAAERRVADSDLDGLRRLRDELDAFTELTTASFERYMALNECFHDTIDDLAGSPILSRMLERAKSLPFASASAMVFSTSLLADSHRTLALAQEHHRAIAEAIGNGEGMRAEYLAREHALIARTAFERVLSNDAHLDTVPGGALIAVAGR